MKHVAYNIETGEVITTSKSNHLKRCIKRANRWNIQHGYPCGKWIFAHNKQDRIRRQLDVSTT